MQLELEQLEKELTEYTELVMESRVLSAVSTDGATGPDEYSRMLRRDYRRIGELGARCHEILRGSLYPLLRSEEPMDEQTRELLRRFCARLLQPASGEELDLTLLFRISDRLCREYLAAGDDNGYARQLNNHLSVCYANVNRTARITVSRGITSFYSAEGLKAAEALLPFLKPEKFRTLNTIAKSSVLNGTRFYSALYDTFYAAPESNRARYQALVDAIHVYEDPFYRENAPEYNWKRFYIRCLEHMGQLTERGNRWGFGQEECKEIDRWMERLAACWEEDPSGTAETVPEAHYRLILHRSAYFAGRLTKKEYQDGLLELYERFVNDEYDMYSVQINLLIPAEYLASLRGERISARQEAVLRRMYIRVIDYVLGSVNMDAFNYLQEYLVGFLETFIEIPGVMSFEDMGLSCLAALHPPTYVHSLQVADLSKCLGERLVERRPELFVGICGCTDEADVRQNAHRILDYIYHSALCHDFGKITMIDSVFVYVRDLLGEEYTIIREHGAMGAEMLGRHSSTADFCDTALHHHDWYDLSQRYDETDRTPLSVTVNIVAAADCIDAATDAIGRSYHAARSEQEIVDALLEGSGTRYAPYVAELLRDGSVREDIHYYLTEGRESNYRKTCLLLNGVHDRRHAT